MADSRLVLPTTIDEVIDQLREIVANAERVGARDGYFAALYLRVTEEIRRKILAGYFENNEHMEKLDVAFANRYIAAYNSYAAHLQCTESWQLSFQASRKWKPLVIQHLLLGMNAHIGLDLGIAAATVCPGDAIQSLENDFNKINDVLADLVATVRSEVTTFWPLLKPINWLAGKLENEITVFSMDTARAAAWRVASRYALLTTDEQRNKFILDRDQKVAAFSKKIYKPAFLVDILVRLLRVFERGTIREKIEALNSHTLQDFDRPNKKVTMKRIITCSDGTWNKPNTNDHNIRVHTNVQKIFDFLRKEDNGGNLQIKHYDEGVGAEGNIFTRYINGATGKGIDDNIKSAYKFIVWNYQPGDELFLFGFSRGAYTARSLAGLIRKCGIIKTNNLDLINDAYALYREKKIGPEHKTAQEFRKQNSHSIYHIKFVGVWDTVGALGIPLSIFQQWNKSKYSFYDTTLSSIIEHAYQALAIDEKRGAFAPTHWKKSGNKNGKFDKQHLEERWFNGVHSNIGGGYPNEGLSDFALKWMIEKARNAGLAFHEDLVKYNIHEDALGTMYDSRQGIYRLLPKYDRPVRESGDGTETTDPSVWEHYEKTREPLPKNLRDIKPKKK